MVECLTYVKAHPDRTSMCGPTCDGMWAAASIGMLKLSMRVYIISIHYPMKINFILLFTAQALDVVILCNCMLIKQIFDLRKY